MKTPVLTEKNSFEINPDDGTTMLCPPNMSASAFETFEVSKHGDSEIKNEKVGLRRWKTSFSICDLSVSTFDSDFELLKAADFSNAGHKATPTLQNAPILLRRYANCDLSGDCQISEPEENTKICKQKVPLFEHSYVSLTNESANLIGKASWRCRLFNTLKDNFKRVTTKNGEENVSSEIDKNEEVCAVTGNHVPSMDLFHLKEGSRGGQLVRKPSFFSISETTASQNL